MFSASGELDVMGGLADCSQATNDGSHTIIDGGGITDPVFRMTAATGELVMRSYLTIQHGDEDGSGQGEDIAIDGNIARFDAGGIVNDGTEMTMTQPDSSIANNHAPNGYGGGLVVLGDNRRAHAYLGTSGLGARDRSISTTGDMAAV